MKLQKMKYHGAKGTVVCAIDTLSPGGEFTVCGNNSIDAGVAEEDDWDIIGNPYDGKLKDVTCPNCLRHIKFIKGLE